MKARSIKRILFSFLFMLMLLPFFQANLGLFELRPLTGTFTTAEKVSFSSINWFEGSFQKAYDTWFEENIGFRNFLIRSYNQVDFSLFNTLHGDVIAGKKGYLFQEPYLNAHIGKDFIGQKEINERMERINFVSERLKEKGIHVIIVFAPTKADFYPEYLPSYYSATTSDSTNYDSFRKILKDGAVPFIDFNDYFLKIKDTSRYSLYPKQGIHWSQYGVYLAVDSMLKFMKEKNGVNLKDLYCTNVAHSSSLTSTDYDIGDLSNVLYGMNHGDMPYPVLKVEDNPGKPRPNLLAIGDSYYWNIYYSEIPTKIFSGPNFWYYNHDVYCDSLPGKQVLDIADFMTSVEKQQIVLILQTESNLNNLGFGFFEMAYELLQNNNNALLQFEQQIRNDPEWLKLVTKKAAERNVSVDEMIRSDAEWMARQKNPNE